jgi:hypothetical protein
VSDTLFVDAESVIFTEDIQFRAVAMSNNAPVLSLCSDCEVCRSLRNTRFVVEKGRILSRSSRMCISTDASDTLFMDDCTLKVFLASHACIMSPVQGPQQRFVVRRREQISVGKRCLGINAKTLGFISSSSN